MPSTLQRRVPAVAGIATLALLLLIMLLLPEAAREVLRDNAFDRSAWRELNHGERDQHDPENRGDHEQDAAGDVRGHNCLWAR